ncbi:hypothetical protein AVEN_153517-1 [Araneus ventricosus]|uniref:Uncharacterized protein n=1 Tax=Araneus ventricosus TaxID=182803 RepID=A0A4Y2UQU1_ARAVE|nr:hypothetical protein AVEN_153517-1 [Araneus ventricosus]
MDALHPDREDFDICSACRKKSASLSYSQQNTGNEARVILKALSGSQCRKISSFGYLQHRTPSKSRVIPVKTLCLVESGVEEICLFQVPLNITTPDQINTCHTVKTTVCSIVVEEMCLFQLPLNIRTTGNEARVIP